MDKKAWLVLLLIGSGEAAIAQTASTRPPSFGSAGRAREPTRHIGIRAAVDGSYDSNVFGLSDLSIEQRGLKGRSKDDFSLSPALNLDIFLPFGRKSVFASGSIGYDFYARNSQLNRERINMNLGGNLQVMSSCSTGVSLNYSRARSDAGDVFVENEGLISRGNTRELRSIGGHARCGGSIGISPAVSYNHAETRNTNDLFKLNDSNQDSVEGSLGYQRPSLGRISIYGSYSTGEYLNRNVLGLPDVFPGIPRDGVKSYSAGARFERSIGSRISGSASFGYSWVNPKAVFSQKFRGATYALNLNVIPTTRLSIDLDASRSTNLSNTVLATFSVTELYAFNSTYKLNDRLNLNFGTSLRKQNFHQTAATIDNTTTLKNDKFTRYYGGFVYSLNRRIRLNGLVSFQRRSADNPLFRYNNTTASLGASLALGR